MTGSAEDARESELQGLDTPAIVSEQEWNAAWNRMLVKEKAHSRARDALVAERRRMPWVEVKKSYNFVGPSVLQACSTSSQVVAS